VRVRYVSASAVASPNAIAALEVVIDAAPDRRTAADRALAFQAAYRASWTPVFRFALAWTNDWAAAEDLAQEAFVRLWRRRHDVDWNEPLLPWLITTTRNLATDRFRRLRRVVGMAPARGHTTDHAGLDGWLDVQAAFGHLSRLERTAVVLVAILGLNSEEAATLLDSTSGAVRAAVRRAREKLEQER
jgi:RNA polymerase sigma-70 factor (ECF subfamily)